MRPTRRRASLLAVAVASSWLAEPVLPAQAPAWDAPPEAKALQNPVRMDGRTVERGKKLFEQQCVPCHGASGTGDGTMARKLGYKPADLTLEKMSRLADGEVFWKISKGKLPMPTFEQKLSDRDRWDLVSYVRTLVKALQ